MAVRVQFPLRVQITKSMSSISLKPFYIYLKGLTYKVTCSSNNTHIDLSYRCKSITDMKSILYAIRDNDSLPFLAIHVRTISSMIIEWRAHNLLYSMGIEKERTRSVDLSINEPWYKKIGYFILSLFYFRG